jgi:LPXTG-motif cell wall-anchored protein
LVGTAKKFHERMIMEKNGPWMLIIGLLFGIGGVVGILYYIKKNIAN